MSNLIELTEKQKAIQSAKFYDKFSKVHFRINVNDSYTTNLGELAYKLEGSRNCYYTEDVLMTAIYTGKCKKGLIDITAK